MNYQNVKTQGKQLARSGYNKVSGMNSDSLMKFMKFTGIATLIIVIVMFSSKILSTAKSLFGLGGKQGDGVNDINDTWLPWDKKPSKESAGSTYEGNKPETKKPAQPKQSVRNLVDEIYGYLQGVTLLYYPEVVNKLANLNMTDLKQACAYWGQKYRAGENELNFYQFLSKEDWSGYYKPALGALKKTGYYG